MLKSLENHYSNISLPGPFLDFEDLLVRNGVLGPYLPYVGKQYKKYEILFFLTAQNLAKEVDLTEQYERHPTESLNRLNYKWSRRPGHAPKKLAPSNVHSQLDLGPVSGGVIPALCAIYLKAKHGLWIENVDEAMSYLAVTNFFKLSLARNNRDLNPSQLGTRSMSYSKIMFETFVRKELEVLKPKVVFCFRGDASRILKEALAESTVHIFELIEINDTAWILRGGGPCLKKGGSWDCKTPEIDALLKGFESWLGWSYKGKREAVKSYLRHYYQQLSAPQTEQNNNPLKHKKL